MCRAAFNGVCDVFLHTWSNLDKAAAFGERTQFRGRQCLKDCHLQRKLANRSAWPCVTELDQRLSLTAVRVERQTLHEAAWPQLWRTYFQGNPASAASVMSFAMNSASMQAGTRLMTSHSSSMHVRYAAALRMRSDFAVLQGDWALQFPTNATWDRVRRRANDPEAGSRQPELACCDHQRGKRYDFCFWSAPVKPLVRVVEHLDSLLGRDASSKTLLDCRTHLNRSRGAAVWMTEGFLLCAVDGERVRLT